MTGHPLPLHHFPEELLLDHAAGSLPEGLALLVASHAALCPACRQAIEAGEALGGALLSGIAPAALAPDALERTLARLDAEEPAAEAVPSTQADDILPAPLSACLGGGFDSLSWRRLLPGLEVAKLSEGTPGARLPIRLLRLAPGAAVPRHSHSGLEVALVLSGGFDDAGVHYERGDVQLADPSLDHRPVAAPGGPCICLVYEEAPVRLTGPLGRWFNRFIRA